MVVVIEVPVLLLVLINTYQLLTGDNRLLPNAYYYYCYSYSYYYSYDYDNDHDHDYD